MQRINIISKKIKKLIVKLAKQSANVEANTACPLFGYQPIEPQEVKSLRKF